MTPDQVEDAGWSSEDWDSLNELAVRTVEKNARVRRVLPEGPNRPNAYMVEVPRADGFNFKVDTTRKVSRIKIDFTIEAEQLHDMENIRAQVARVATALAQWEDRVLAYGKDALALPHRDIKLTLDPQALGLFHGAAATNTQADAIDRVKEGIETVLSASRGGILRAVFGFNTYTALIRSGGKDRNGIDHSRALLGGDSEDLAWLPPDPKPPAPPPPQQQPQDGQREDDVLAGANAELAADANAGALPAQAGAAPAFSVSDKVAVFSPDPGSIDLVWTQRPRISHVGVKGGNLTLRLEEAFFLRIKDRQAIGVAS